MATATEVLKLELSILEALLNRSRTSHGRTLYYKRMQMVFQCCHHRKCAVLDFQRNLKEYVHVMMTQKDQPWTMDGTTTLSSSSSPIDVMGTCLRTVCTKGFPELLSRIHHAAKALVSEIGRGFFLPFCTVAFAALARIRTLVQQLGQQGIVELSKIDTTLDQNNKYMMLYIDDNDDEIKEDDKMKEKEHLQRLARSLGVVIKQATTITTTTAPTTAVAKSRSLTSQKMKQHEPSDKNIQREQEEMKKAAQDMDVGQQVGFIHNKPVVGEDKPQIIDHNLDILMQTKSANKKKKRKLEAEMETKSKKEKKKKKKRDVFDDIFGA